VTKVVGVFVRFSCAASSTKKSSANSSRIHCQQANLTVRNFSTTAQRNLALVAIV
jgi:hypothetical protein